MEEKFELGNVYLTAGVSNKVQESTNFAKFVLKSLEKHHSGVWGDLCDEDKEMNEDALKSGLDRLFSKYNYDGEISIYIITEWNRQVTTILFPEEY